MAPAEGSRKSAFVEILGFFGDLSSKTRPGCRDAAFVATRPAVTPRVGHVRGQRASPHVRQLGQDRCHAHVIYLPEIGAPYYPVKHAARSHFIPVAFRSVEAADWATAPLRNHQHTLRDGSLDNTSLPQANWTYRPGTRREARVPGDQSAPTQRVGACTHCVVALGARSVTPDSTRTRARAVGRSGYAAINYREKLEICSLGWECDTALLAAPHCTVRQVSASPRFVLPPSDRGPPGSLGAPHPGRSVHAGQQWRGRPELRLPPPPGPPRRYRHRTCAAEVSSSPAGVIAPDVRRRRGCAETRRGPPARPIRAGSRRRTRSPAGC